MSNNVNHPKHYNSHPNGIECIDIIRHYVCDIANAIKYLWRAGLKPEMGMEDAEKEIEDLKKALWYIEDISEYKEHNKYVMITRMHGIDHQIFGGYVKEITGHTIAEITSGYDENISEAIDWLLHIGLIYKDGQVLRSRCTRWCIDGAIEAIQRRILDIERLLLSKEISSTVQVLRGQLADGEDYVSKPGCVRETEPEHYDPLNMIVALGRVYSLTDEVHKKPNGALYSPCDNCDLIETCYDDWRHPDKSTCHDLCRLHQAQTNEYYREVGVAKYSPSFGTVEVIDENKETEIELKRLEEEE